MALALEAHILDLATQVFKRRKQLVRLLDVAAQILFAMQNQQGGVDIFGKGDR